MLASEVSHRARKHGGPGEVEIKIGYSQTGAYSCKVLRSPVDVNYHNYPPYIYETTG